MRTLVEQIRQGAGDAWATVSAGWHALRARAGSALTRFRRDGAAAGAAAAGIDALLATEWGLMAADIRVDVDRVVARIEAPGLAREDLHIEVRSDQLSVWGEKRLDSESAVGDHRLLQCAYGSFRRELDLPVAVDPDRAQASYRDGVLRITVPRREPGQGRRIAVQHG